MTICATLSLLTLVQVGNHVELSWQNVYKINIDRMLLATNSPLVVVHVKVQ